MPQLIVIIRFRQFFACFSIPLYSIDGVRQPVCALGFHIQCISFIVHSIVLFDFVNCITISAHVVARMKEAKPRDFANVRSHVGWRRISSEIMICQTTKKSLFRLFSYLNDYIIAYDGMHHFRINAVEVIFFLLFVRSSSFFGVQMFLTCNCSGNSVGNAKVL